ncbi:cobalamin biosynthesis protein CbiX [Planctomonas sp. JC2975]|uniref:sirohydrochlorin chelatase n=1 Tax=Planctomonas sp. JC2975 TaxID=2729626 RepID=UPI0014753007|nr:CbiX/SirB N-terminal domain-containing protein [Planctomonas sp. JC2975]NNC11358.1 cobalamin biosynthesis protein CbiX [Planctomonas sp. JC2975]
MTATLFAASHGTSSPAGQAAVRALVTRVAAATTMPVVGCHVDVEQPDVPTAIAEARDADHAIVVPLLLSAGYHVFVDLADAARSASIPATVSAALGPDERLVDVLARRLDEAGRTPHDSIVLAAAGSSDPRALEDCRRTGRMLAARLSTPVTVGFLSAASPSLGDAVAEARRTAPDSGVLVSTYLLAPGYFLDLVLQAGADRVADPLLTPDSTPRQLVDVVLDRASDASAAAGLPEIVRLR